jgi:hypothetical protein
VRRERQRQAGDEPGGEPVERHAQPFHEADELRARKDRQRHREAGADDEGAERIAGLDGDAQNPRVDPTGQDDEGAPREQQQGRPEGNFSQGKIMLQFTPSR